jgi:hypothetical protein
MTTNFWQIPPEWQGENAFIVAGGPSVKSIDLELLRGQRVIAVNSSFRAVPFADFLIFGDGRWWEFNKRHLTDWPGRIVCCSLSPREKHLLKVRRCPPPGLSQKNDTLVLQFTTATSAIDLASKLGARRIILLGLDGKNGPDGITHHHAPHPWRQNPGWEKKHYKDLQTLIEPLKQRGIAVVHGTPGSAYGFWPTIDLKSILPENTAVAA